MLREPRVSVWNTPFPRFNVELEGNDSVKLGGGRLDYQLGHLLSLDKRPLETALRI